MPETREPMRPVRVDMTCDSCAAGKMRGTGVVLACYPPLYPHKCTACGELKQFRVAYPFITYESAGVAPGA